MRKPTVVFLFWRRIVLWLVALAVPGVALLGATAASDPTRQIISLKGDWQFQRDGTRADEWKTVQVPSSFQSHEGTEFHGVGWYRKAIEHFPLPPGKRVLLHFQAAATEAEVWWNGQRLGSHLDGWTPFRFDITELVKQGPTGGSQELKVRLDEKVGHNTQGFLPIIAPHFGGLWQDVSLLIVPETYIDDLLVMAIGDAHSGELRVEVPLAGSTPDLITNAALRYRLRGEKSPNGFALGAAEPGRSAGFPTGDTRRLESRRYGGEIHGEERWTDLAPTIQRAGNTLRFRAAVAEARRWSPAEPNLYEVEITLPGQGGDRLQTRAAFRSIETFGSEFRLNGQPLSIRGLLNWGYSAPLVAPNPGEQVWRSELEFARSHGFNLMKFCLWVPPTRYLELADEMGMLTWVEYPTWHPNFSEKFLEPLRREFREFFAYDRNHPSVILRSLTCETGPSADLKVIQSLYDSAHEMIPGALVEDDSSWIGWNRVHDFYDDHPYGNNHTWVKTLAGFNEHILAHGLKPLVLGEAIAADTWPDREAVLTPWGNALPWWIPGVVDDMARWTDQMRGIAGPGGLDQLRADSLRYGLLMRKFQIEAYRREIPYGGYVISVIRDIPNASMGLLDYLGRSKWSDAEWSWQRDTMCLLRTAADRRSFNSGERLRGEILLSHFGQKAIADGQLEVTLESFGKEGPPLQRRAEKGIQQNPGTLAQLVSLDWPAPEVATPTHLVIRAVLKTPQGEFRNEWPIWVVPSTPPLLSNAGSPQVGFPSPRPSPAGRGGSTARVAMESSVSNNPVAVGRGSLSPGERGGVRGKESIERNDATAASHGDVSIHRSLAAELAQELFPQSERFTGWGGAGGSLAPRVSAVPSGATPDGTGQRPVLPDGILVASRFDDDLVRFLEAGGRVLFLPDSQRDSFALAAHWFLRGAPYVPDSTLTSRVPRDLFVELQHFDLASDVVPNLPQLESFDPLLMLWDTHDQKTLKTRGLIFETRVAKGRLLVSAVRHTGPTNAAGRWLLGVLLDHLRSEDAPRHALPDDVWAYLKARLHAEQTNLVSRTWRFKPDPKNEGLARGWQSPTLAPEDGWKDIRIGTWWELQGWPAVDGLAWYRLEVDIPERWQGRAVFLSFEGVDDSYELYVNGELVGQGGDRATRRDALSEKKSWNITRLVKPGRKALIAVRVDDWQGYGGIFRPVTLGTLAFNPALDLLK